MVEQSSGSTSVEARAASAVHEEHGLTWLPAWRLREMIIAQEVSSVEVVQHFLRRIEELDPNLNAFRRIDARGALEQAQRADESVRAGRALGSLCGVPIAVKELFSVRGFPAPGGYAGDLEDREDGALATRDDVEIERLRAAGAVIVGVTVAAVGPTPTSSQSPSNPWNLSHTPGGSSAGNAAAVAAGLVPLAIGDDGAGSIRLPSAFCGLVGLSPSRGLVPHVDYESAAPRPTVTVGPMARNVRDAAVALEVLAGPDGRDFVCLQDEPPDYLVSLDSGVRGVRFIWTADFGYASMPASVRSPRTLCVLEEAASVLGRGGGAVNRAATTWEDPLLSWLAAQQLVSGPTADGFAEDRLSDREIVAALNSRDRNWRRFRAIFDENDFVISPTVQFPAPDTDTWTNLCQQEGGRPRHSLVFDSFAHTMLCNVLGLPAISVPAGFVDGMPVGLQIIGRPGSESGLLRAAQALLNNGVAREDSTYCGP